MPPTPSPFPQSIALYRHLLREIRARLPLEARGHYEHAARQCFVAFADERDAGRVEQIVARAREDAAWVVKKYSGWEGKDKALKEKERKKKG